MNLLRYLEKNIDDFTEKKIINMEGGSLIYKGCLQDISFDIDITKMYIRETYENEIIVVLAE